jgi:tight adherence protein B
MTALLLAALGGLGVHFVYTAIVLRWPGLAPGPAAVDAPRQRDRRQEWLTQAGLSGVDPVQFAAVVVATLLFGCAVGYALFGTVIPAVLLGAFAASLPLTSYRVRRRRRLSRVHEAWPQLIEEIRILTGSAGRSVPQALFEVGRRAPEPMRPAFAAAQRTWLLTTDFDHTIDSLKAALADPTADVTTETLIVAHRLGGTDLQARLIDLAEDRVTDVQARKDAVARQAGVRFARWFTVAVPLGMGLVGMSIGNGRAAYGTPGGQAMVVAAILLMIICWVWAGAIMRLPEEQRVFPEAATRARGASHRNRLRRRGRTSRPDTSAPAHPAASGQP